MRTTQASRWISAPPSQDVSGNRGCIKPGDIVDIIGPGAIGLMTEQFALEVFSKELEDQYSRNVMQAENER